ncbi:hypothetical protein [Stutzerimonas stutzeri]|uniref:hypothetical protein n=1 Tax=Stutzerimonas stutzeri TaxID=316 RepID=UPI001F402AA1|nr:hypothetical protein [Stutzerimonas stutzeri]
MNTETTETCSQIPNGLEGRDCVPFFSSSKSQIIFEFFYLVTAFFVAILALLMLQFFGSSWGVPHSDKLVMMAVIGGFLGGWVYDTKWFYRVTARGKNDQYRFAWQPHKFYWRLMTPFLASMVAFTSYLLVIAEIFPFYLKDKESARTAFAICFLLGYFSDLVLSRLAAWAESVLPKVSNGQL